MTSKSTTARAKSKAVKPYADYPLTAHRNGSWCKKVRGVVVFFGPLHNPQAALDLWLLEKDELLAGRHHTEVRNRDRTVSDRLTIKEAIDAFLTTKEQHADAGQITRRHFNDLQGIGKLLADQLGRTRPLESLTPQKFGELRAALSKRYGPTALLRTMICIRSIFRFAKENKLIQTPVEYGTMFALPTKKEMRLQRASKPKRLFAAADLHEIIGAAGVQMKAMILLGINAGLGNSDIGNLEFRHLDLAGGWLCYPRPKTGIGRKCKLWPETTRAIEAAIAKRPKPTNEKHAEFLFITKYGELFAKEDRNNPVSAEFRKLLASAGLHREGLGFYALRHCMETIGGAAKDQVALDLLMGHCDPSMSAEYREEIGDDRLEAIAEHVHRWLFGDTKTKAKPAKPTAKRATRKPREQAERPALPVFG
jgi:integrase